MSYTVQRREARYVRECRRTCSRSAKIQRPLDGGSQTTPAKTRPIPNLNMIVISNLHLDRRNHHLRTTSTSYGVQVQADIVVLLTTAPTPTNSIHNFT
jgi:hypothetical protein